MESPKDIGKNKLPDSHGGHKRKPDTSQSFRVSKSRMNLIYAAEADVLNVALFGKTAKEWRDENPDKEGSIRDYASLELLVVLTNLESINAMLINQGLEQAERLLKLNELGISQMKSLLSNKNIRKLK
jgi:hypothetical protein